MTKPFIKWNGGKGKLVPQLLAHAPAHYNRYYEPFVGGGALLFHTNDVPARIADANNELMKTWWSVKTEPRIVIALLEHHERLNSKEYFYEVVQQYNEGRIPFTSLHESEIAGMFIYLNRVCFNGMYRVNKKGGFNSAWGARDFTIDYDNLWAVHEFLRERDVDVVSEDFGDLFNKQRGWVHSNTVIKTDSIWDGTFIYCDPPYDGSTIKYHKDGFGEAEQRRLALQAEVWHNSGSYVMLSNADSPLVRELYSELPFFLHEVEGLYVNSGSVKGRGKTKELIITTYEVRK